MKRILSAVALAAGEETAAMIQGQFDLVYVEAWERAQS